MPSFDERMAELRAADTAWIAANLEHINDRDVAERAVTDLFPLLSNERLHHWAQQIRDEIGKEGSI